MFIDTVYIRLLLVTLLYTVSLLSPDCVSQHVREDAQFVLKQPKQGYDSPVTKRPGNLQVRTTTETPNYYYYDDDYYDYYVDHFVTTTTTTTTTTPPPTRRHRQFGRGRLRNKFRRPILRIRPVIVGNDYTKSHEISLQSTSETTQTPSTTLATPITDKPRRHYSPRGDGRYIDYLSDPNRPRELNGVDLSTYPFYISVPEDIDFKCEGRHDGYYASISHKCQLFHWCFGRRRFDFLCPNYTLYDQTTFTCRFVNKVDCESSELYYDRNNELYVESTDVPEKERKEEKRKRKWKSKNKNKNRSKKNDDNYEDEEVTYDVDDTDYDERK